MGDNRLRIGKDIKYIEEKKVNASLYRGEYARKRYSTHVGFPNGTSLLGHSAIGLIGYSYKVH